MIVEYDRFGSISSLSFGLGRTERMLHEERLRMNGRLGGCVI
jgi:hypothetical protein